MLPELLPEPRPRLLEEIRFYVDEDILGVGKAMMWLRHDVVTCGIEPVAEEFPRRIDDIDWIQRAAAHGWVSITKNRKIRTNPFEARIATEAKARIVNFAGGGGNKGSWHMMTVLTRRWQAIENQIAAHPDGPWWLNISRPGVRLQSYRT